MRLRLPLRIGIGSVPYNLKGGHMRKFIDGQVFGLLTIVEAYHAKTKYKHWKHLCLCECGSETIQAGVHLRTGSVISCGCSKNKGTGDRSRTHGHSQTRAYKIWKGIKKRCLNKNDNAYEKYGNMGIEICDEWVDDFPRFISDMGWPEEGQTIDRVNGCLGYTRDNCRWASRLLQARNKVDTCSGPRGVSVLPSGRFRAKIGVDNKTRHIGVYDTLEQASLARIEAEKLCWGGINGK